MRTLPVPPFLTRYAFGGGKAKPPAESMVWLRIALGEKSDEAMQLPHEMLNALYGEVMWYGPAAYEITQFLTCLEECEYQAVALQSALMDVSHLGPREMETAIKRWLDDIPVDCGQLLAHLMHESLEATRSWKNEQYGEAATLVCLFLTGQHLFPENLVLKCIPYMDSVNAVLQLAGMRHLAGNFADATSND